MPGAFCSASAIPFHKLFHNEVSPIAMMAWSTRRRTAAILSLVLLGTTVAAVLAFREPSERLTHFPGNCPAAFTLSDDTSAGKHVLTIGGVDQIYATDSLAYSVMDSASGETLAKGPLDDARSGNSFVSYQPKEPNSGTLADGDVIEVVYSGPIILSIIGPDGSELASSGVCQ